MARDVDLNVNIKAKDQASKPLEKVAKTVDKLGEEKVEIPVSADTSEAVRDIDDVLQKVDKLAGTDAAKLVLTSNASQIALEITDLVMELDKLDATDPKIDVIATDIRSLEGDLERLSGKAKELGDQPITLQTAGARQGLDDLGQSAGSSKSVLANMVGNATQDLGALGGVAGSAGVAIGQMGEYMTDAAASGDKMGTILRNFSKVAGPIAGIAVATQLLGEYMKGIKAEEAFKAGLVEDFAAGLRDANEAAETMLETLKETGDLTFTKGGQGFTGFGQKIESVLPVLDTLQLDWQRFQNIVADPAAVSNLENFITQIELSGETTTEELGAWTDLKEIVEQYGGAAREAAAKQEIASRVQREAAKAAREAAREEFIHKQRVDEAAAAYVDASGMVREHGRAAEIAANEINVLARQEEQAAEAALAAAEAHREVAAALQEEIGGASDLAGINRDYAAAVVAANEATIASKEAIKEHGETSKEAAAEATNEADAIIAVSEAAVGQYEAMIQAAGATETATGKLDQQNRVLVEQATQATPAARKQIVDYIGDLNGIPPEERTDILTLLDRGLVAEAEAKINETSRTRTSAINADANTAQAERDLNYTARDRDLTISVNTVGDTAWIARQAGGPVRPDQVYTVGEAGRELFVPNTPGRIVPHGRTEAMLHGVGLAGLATHTTVPVNVTVNTAVIGSTYDVMRAIRKATVAGVRLAGTRT